MSAGGSRTHRLLPGVIAVSLIFVVSIRAQSLTIRTKYQKDDFSLVYKNRPAVILTSAEDFTAVHIAARDLAADVERATGERRASVTDMGVLDKLVLIAGASRPSYFGPSETLVK